MRPGETSGGTAVEIWYHRKAEGKQVWEKQPADAEFPRLRGPKGRVGLDDWLWHFVLKSEEDRYLVFAAKEEKAMERMIRPFTSGGSMYFLEELCGDAVKYRALKAGKTVTFLPVFVDQPGKLGQQCETRLAVWVQLHADMTKHPR